MNKSKIRINIGLLKLFIIILSFFILGDYGFSQIQVQTYQLNNGLRVILSPIENIHSVCVFTYFKTGVRDDPVELKGASTIFKNIRLKSGTRNFNYLEGLLYTKNQGGIAGSKVEYDYSYFYQIVQAENLNIALMLEGERFKSLKLSNRGFQIQKNRHIQRLKRLVNYSRYYNSYLWVNSKLFANSVYQYPVMGSLDKIINIKTDDIDSVYNRYSDPNLTTLIVTGKFDTIEIKRKILKYFSTIKSRGNKTINYSPLNLKTESISATGLSKNVSEHFVIFGIQAPSVLDQSFETFLFMKYFLLDKRRDSISNYLKDKNKLDVSIDFRLSDNIESNSLVIGVSSKTKINIVRTKYLILSYFKNLPTLMLKKKIDIKNIKNLMEIDYRKKLSGLVSRSELLAKSEHFFNNLDINKNILNKIQKIGLYNIIGLCKKYFTQNKIIMLYEYND